MPVDFCWNNEDKSVVHFKFSDPWMISEFAECEVEVRKEMARSNHVVDAILDFSDAHMLPKNAMSYFMSSLRKGETIENEGVSIVYGANALFYALGKSIGRIAKNADIFFVSDLSEVDDILAEARSKRGSEFPTG